jgi:hypothetical protein
MSNDHGSPLLFLTTGEIRTWPLHETSVCVMILVPVTCTN